MLRNSPRRVRPITAALTLIPALAVPGMGQLGSAAPGDVNRDQCAAAGFYGSPHEPCATDGTAGVSSPSPPDLSGIRVVFGMFKEIPEAVFKALTCVPPKKESTAEPSPGLSVCAGTSSVAATSDLQGTYNFFLSDYDRAQTGTPAQLGGILGDIAETQVGLQGVLLTATVEVAHWDAGASEPTSIAFERITGSITADGRFDCTRAIDGTRQGDPVQIVHRTTYDGLHLRDHSAKGEAGNIYKIDEKTGQWITDLYASSIAHLYTWVYDPYLLPLFSDGVVLEEETGPQGQATIRRLHPLVSGGTFVGTEYEVALRDSGALPTRKANLDVSRSVWEEHLFSNFFELRTDDWRPGKIVYTRFLDGAPGGRRITVTTTIVRATTLSAEQAEAVPRPFDEGLSWHVWQ